MKTAFTNCIIYTGDEVLANKAILAEDGIIRQVVAEGEFPADSGIVDLKGLSVAPALIDLQVYGGNNKMFSANPSVAALTATYEEVKTGGAGWFQATVATNSLEIMLQAFAAAKAYKAAGLPGLLGIHLEGPYISSAKRGAQLEQFIRKPSGKEVELLLKEGEGVFTMMTVAPEVCDAVFTERLHEAGVVVSAGHSNCTYETAQASFKKGITAATHLHNAMSPFKNREPGLTGAIFDSNLYASIIPDGIHVDYASLRISKKVMGEKLFLITDAVTSTTDTHYAFKKETDRYVDENGVLAGSSLTMMQGVKNCVQHAGISPEEALRMATLYPARVLGRDRELGKIAAGYICNLVVFDKEFEVIEVIG